MQSIFWNLFFFFVSMWSDLPSGLRAIGTQRHRATTEHHWVQAMATLPLAAGCLCKGITKSLSFSKLSICDRIFHNEQAISKLVSRKGVKDRILKPSFTAVLIRNIPSSCCCAQFCLSRISLWPEGSSSASPGNLLKCISEETSLFCQMTLRWPKTPVFQGGLGQPGSAVRQQVIFLRVSWAGHCGQQGRRRGTEFVDAGGNGAGSCQDLLLHCCKSLATRVSWICRLY